MKKKHPRTVGNPHHTLHHRPVLYGDGRGLRGQLQPGCLPCDLPTICDQPHRQHGAGHLRHHGYGVYIVLQILILRREFRLINLTQIIFSTIFGYFTNFTKWLLADFTLPTYGGQLVMLAISIVAVAFGVFLYMEVDLVAMPMEGLTQAIAKKVGKPFHNVKIVVDCSSVALGIVLSFVFLHGLLGIREGTVITAIVVGKIMGVFKKPLQAKIQKLCFGAVGPVPEEVRELEELEGIRVDD